MFSNEVLSYKNSVKSGEEITGKTNSFFSENYFNENRAKPKFAPPYIPGEIYYFNYQTDSTISSDRPFINRFPVILCTDVIKTEKAGTVIKGIDLIVTPPRNRVDIIGKIYDNFKPQIEKNDLSYEKGSNKSPVKFTNILLDNLLSLTGYKESFFGFKYVFIKTPGVILSKDWNKLPYLSFSAVEGSPIQGIYKEYQSKLNLRFE